MKENQEIKSTMNTLSTLSFNSDKLKKDDLDVDDINDIDDGSIITTVKSDSRKFRKRKRSEENLPIDSNSIKDSDIVMSASVSSPEVRSNEVFQSSSSTSNIALDKSSINSAMMLSTNQKKKKKKKKTKKISNQGGYSKRKPYCKRACFHCRRSHLSCSEGRPCLRCAKFGLNCQDEGSESESEDKIRIRRRTRTKTTTTTTTKNNNNNNKNDQVNISRLRRLQIVDEDDDVDDIDEKSNVEMDKKRQKRYEKSSSSSSSSSFDDDMDEIYDSETETTSDAEEVEEIHPSPVMINNPVDPTKNKKTLPQLSLCTDNQNKNKPTNLASSTTSGDQVYPKENVGKFIHFSPYYLNSPALNFSLQRECPRSVIGETINNKNNNNNNNNNNSQWSVPPPPPPPPASLNSKRYSTFCYKSPVATYQAMVYDAMMDKMEKLNGDLYVKSSVLTPSDIPDLSTTTTTTASSSLFGTTMDHHQHQHQHLPQSAQAQFFCAPPSTAVGGDFWNVF